MKVQIYFSVLIDPPLSAEQIASFYAITAKNLTYPIGNKANGRMLCRAIVDDSVIQGAESMLNSAGKAVVICGVFDKFGVSHESYTANLAEYQSFFEPIQTDDGEVIPASNTAAGWVLPL